MTTTIRRKNRNCYSQTADEQGAAPDRLQLRSLRSFLASVSTLPAAGELGRSAGARSFAETVILKDMPYINVKLENGKEWGVTHCELILPATSLEGMSAEEIGAAVTALQPYVTKFQSYLSGTWHSEYFNSLEDFERAVAEQERDEQQKRQPAQPFRRTGVVYLISGGGYHKIGLTTNLPVRHKQIGAKLPFKSEVVHAITTSDIFGVERYWHNRFAHKRAEGEWFNLSPEEVADFCAHEQMEIAT